MSQAIELAFSYNVIISLVTVPKFSFTVSFGRFQDKKPQF